jgi:hypothetical protein
VLRTDDERGPMVAAGLVLLAVAIFLIDNRFANQWAAGGRLVVTALPALLALAIAFFAPDEDGPPAWLSAILVVEFALVLLALGNLSDALGADSPLGSSGSLTWVGLLVTGLAVVSSRRHNSAVMALIAAVSGTVTFLAAVDWIFDLDNPLRTVRWLLMFSALALAAVGMSVRGRRPRHGVAVIDAAGLVVLALVVTFAVGSFFLIFFGGGGSTPGSRPGWGWELFVLLAGAALVAFAVSNREPGPGYLGGVVLLAFAFLAADSEGEPSLVGWPLVLLLVALALLALALRPRPGARPPA